MRNDDEGDPLFLRNLKKFQSVFEADAFLIYIT